MRVRVTVTVRVRVTVKARVRVRVRARVRVRCVLPRRVSSQPGEHDLFRDGVRVRVSPALGLP